MIATTHLESCVGNSVRPVRLSGRQRLYLRLRRMAEVVAAGLLLLLALPVLAGAMLLVRATSKGPALYSQIRLGKHGRSFRIYKIRTMLHDCESITGPRWCIPGDPRVTYLGHYLRKLHIDELPQLVNVIRGDMSLIGPRPERPEIAAELRESIRNFDDRLAVRPGITGLAQVQLAPDTEVEGVREKLALDLEYLQRVGPWLDVQIVYCTLLKMVGVPYTRARQLLGTTPPARVFENAVRPTPMRKAA